MVLLPRQQNRYNTITMDLIWSCKIWLLVHKLVRLTIMRNTHSRQLTKWLHSLDIVHVPRCFWAPEACNYLCIFPQVLHDVDTILFCLLMLRSLSDSQGRVWRCHPSQLYTVEVTLPEQQVGGWVGGREGGRKRERYHYENWRSS